MQGLTYTLNAGPDIQPECRALKAGPNIQPRVIHMYALNAGPDIYNIHPECRACSTSWGVCPAQDVPSAEAYVLSSWSQALCHLP
jgi:hypothetical protein